MDEKIEISNYLLSNLQIDLMGKKNSISAALSISLIILSTDYVVTISNEENDER